MPSDEPAAPRLILHSCMVCGSDDAPYGFDTRGSTVWTCQARREDGEAMLAAPMRGGVVRTNGGEQR